MGPSQLKFILETDVVTNKWWHDDTFSPLFSVHVREISMQLSLTSCTYEERQNDKYFYQWHSDTDAEVLIATAFLPMSKAGFWSKQSLFLDNKNFPVHPWPQYLKHLSIIPDAQQHPRIHVFFLGGGGSFFLGFFPVAWKMYGITGWTDE